MHAGLGNLDWTLARSDSTARPRATRPFSTWNSALFHLELRQTRNRLIHRHEATHSRGKAADRARRQLAAVPTLGSLVPPTVLIQMKNNLTSQETRSGDACREAICESGRLSIRFEDLPLDSLYKIVSKLPSKEFARTRFLSSRWRWIWPACPRLTFDGVEVCKCDRADLHQHIGKFIHEVNAVLQKHRGIVVETLEVRFDFVDNLLVHHLDNWVHFAVSSRTKNLTLELKPEFCGDYKGRYVFPFKLLDNGCISRLQQLHLSCASLKPPSQFNGFPNLRKLCIQIVHVDRKDLEHVLSHCCNLEWLRIGRCHLNDELVVDVSLSHLRYLHIEHCRLTKIKFHAVNLVTFLYDDFIPIDLTRSSKLQNTYIKLDEAVFQHALTSLINGIPHIYLQLFMHILPEVVDEVLYSVSFLRATPFIEKLEVHFTGHRLWLADVGPYRKELGHSKYFYLKNLRVTGFKGARGQLEFLLHVVENAPALEVVTVNTNQEASKEFWPYEASCPPFEEAKRIAVTSLTIALPQNVNFSVI
ncbi:hypothetical protein EJB05_38841, partial [Eragrostis curvula]